MAATEHRPPRWLRLLAPPGLFALAVAVRALPAPIVFVNGAVQPFGNDAYYHLRRIVYSLLHYPAVLTFDPYINHPHGAKPIWTPVFDWVLGTLLRPALAEGGLPEVERLAMWAPPLLGGATVVTLYFLAKRNFSPAVALLGGLVLSLMGGHFWYSQIGFVDHHAAVAWVTTLLLAASMTFLRRHAEAPEAIGAGLASGATLGLALGASLLLWPGTLLHVGLVESGLLAYLATREHRGHAVAFAARFALANAVALLLVLPAGLTSSWPQWSRFSPVVLSGFQPWLFGVLTLFGLLCARLWQTSALARSRPRRAVSALMAGALLVGASASLFPELLDGAGDAWSWFARRDGFQALVAESAPLLVWDGRLDLGIAASRLSLFFFVFPLAIAGGVFAVHRERYRAPILLFLWWSLGLLVATLYQRRFFNTSSVALSLLLAWAVCGIYTGIAPHLLETRPRRIAARAAVTAVVLALLAPVLATYAHPLRNCLRAIRGEKLHVTARVTRQHAAVLTARWLREMTPETSGWLDPAARPEYGILSPWPLGHLVEYVARRPTVTDNFGDDIGAENHQLAQEYFRGDEESGAAILDHLRVRYVLVQAGHRFLGEKQIPGGLLHRLYDGDGVGVPPSPVGRGRDALTRHRLVFESIPEHPALPLDPSVYKVFEYVAGARIEGRARPGTGVSASVVLRTNRTREVRYWTAVAADAGGRYAIRVPYANVGGPASVRVADTYEIRCDGEVATVAVDEAAVAGGRIVAGPDLCGGG